MGEAPIEETGAGLAPAGPGWFVVNVGEAAWRGRDAHGFSCRFESEKAEFGELGINLRVLEPGKPNCMYHRESSQEDFLVLAGECLLLVEGQERRLRAWDFFHCPPGVEHVFVGAGEGPCVILMVGSRAPDERVFYPVSELAQRYDASVERETDSPAEAYARFPKSQPGHPPGWDRLPWSEGIG